MTILFLALWLHMSAQPSTMYESMCQLPRVEYGERYQVIVGAGECYIFERNVGEVYWRGPHGEAILFPIGSPLDDITRAEFAESAQRAADETDGKESLTGYPLEPCKTNHERWCVAAVDVPAVQEWQKQFKKGLRLPQGSCEVRPAETDQVCRALWDIYDSKLTCADKSRVLLTSEDGKKHCIKF